MFGLLCKDCQKLSPYVATTEDEMLYPSVEVCSCCGGEPHDGQSRAAEAIQSFQNQHSAHDVEVVEA